MHGFGQNGGRAAAIEPLAGPRPAPARGQDPLRHRILPGPGDAGDWDDLGGAARWPTQAFAFVEALAATMLAGSTVVTHWVGDDAGPAGLISLCNGAAWLARRRLVGACEIHEPIDALCRDEAAAAALARALVRDPRPLVMDRVPATSPLIGALRRAMRGRGVMVVRPAHGCPTLALDAGWRDPASRFNAGRRSDFRRAERRAAELGAVSFEVHAPEAAAFGPLFDEAITVEAKGWKSGAGSAILVDRAKQAFFRRFLAAAASRGQCRVAFLRIAGQAVAMQIALVADGRLWLLKIGYDEDYRRVSPGTLLMLRMLAHAAGEGLRAVEFLGEVEPWIAELWTRDSHACVRVAAYRASLRGAVALTADTWAWARQHWRRGGR